MNELQKKYAVKELKSEIKENIKRKLYRFFFIAKALMTIVLFIYFEYLMITHKMPTNYYFHFLQIVMLAAVTIIVSCSACILQAIKHQCYDNIDKLCTLFAASAITIFSFSFVYVSMFSDFGNVVSNTSSFDDLPCQLIFWLFIFRFLQLKTNKERLRDLGFKVPEEKSTNFSEEENRNGQ